MILSFMEWLTSFFVIALAAICWRRDVRWVLFFLLIYSVLYFLPSVVPLLDGTQAGDIARLRFSGSSNFMKIQAILVLAFSGYALYRCAWPIVLRSWCVRVGLMGGLLLAGLILEVGVVSRLQLQNVLSVFLMCTLGSLGADAWERAQVSGWRDEVFARMAVLLLLMLFGSVVLAYVEILYDKAWSRYMASNGYVIIRASAMMFNPNLYAMWCSVLAIGFAFFWQARVLIGRDTWLLLGVYLAGLGVFLSSARSLACLLLLFFVGTAAMLPHGHGRRWLPSFVYVLSLFSATAVSVLAWRLGGGDSAAHHFVLLGERLMAAPIQLVAVLMDQIAPGSLWEGQAVRPEAILAFEGRFQGEGRDSGFLTAYDDAGVLGLFAMVVFWGSLSYFGVKAFWRRQDIHTIYALGLVGYGLVVGVIMRYQVFPVWVFLAVMLAPCLALWRTVLPKVAFGFPVWL